MKYINEEIAGKNLYCDSSCIIEAIIHAHVNKPPVRKGAAKIWIHPDGRTTIAEKGDMPDDVLGDVRDFIKANIILMRRRWAAWSGVPTEAIVYFRGDIKECWTCEYGKNVLGDKTFYDSEGELRWVQCKCTYVKDSDPEKLIDAYSGKDCKFWMKHARANPK